ncbi:MAG: glycosyltransferase family 1 protein [Cyanobacteria bacterium J06648_1]
MPKLPKIAINGTYIQEQASGLGVVNQNLISRLMDCSEECKGDRHFDFTLYSHADTFQSKYGDRVAAVDPGLSPDRGFSGHLKRIWWYQTKLKQRLKQEQADLFFSPVYEGMFFPHVPQILTVHDLIPLKYPELSPKWKYYYQYALPFLLKQSQRIICVSEFTKQDLVNTYSLNPDSIDVVYNGYDRNLFYPQPNSTVIQKYGLDKYLLYVGDMRFYKNLGRTLEAFDRLNDKDCQFVITGKKDDFFYPEIAQQVAKLASRDRIIFLDYVPTAELPTLYSLAQALVFASLYEGFGLPVLEAMACGCPVITSQVTSIPEVGGDSVLYVDPNDVDSIAQGMQQILTNSELQTDLKHQGLARAKLFSWDKTAEDVYQIFGQLTVNMRSGIL